MENSAEASEHALENVLLREDWEVADAYEVDTTPGAVVVSPEGIISSPVAEGPEEVAALVAYAVGERAQLPLFQSAAGHAAHDEEEDDEPEGPEVGEPAPEIGLRTSRQGRQPRRFQGRRGPGALLQPWVRLLPGNDARHQAVGGRPT